VAQSTVIGADGVSISLARHGRVRTVAATDATVAGMDQDQFLSGEGPCLDAADMGRGVYVAALAEEERWPGFVPRARSRGIESILSTPLRLSGEPTGALNIYSFTPGAFSDQERELAGVFATRASQLLADAGI
jgi:GAF domain-containing protein